MAMNVGQDSGDEDVPISDINTTPLVDVMLVLLIIFLITVPVVIQTVPVSLPKVKYEPTTTKPENVSLSVRNEPDGSCGVYWNLTKVNSEEYHRGKYARGAYPRGHQYSLQVHRWGRLHHAAGGFRARRIHFRAAAERLRRIAQGAFSHVDANRQRQ